MEQMVDPVRLDVRSFFLTEVAQRWDSQEWDTLHAVVTILRAQVANATSSGLKERLRRAFIASHLTNYAVADFIPPVCLGTITRRRGQRSASQNSNALLDLCNVRSALEGAADPTLSEARFRLSFFFYSTANSSFTSTSFITTLSPDTICLPL